jgi:NADH-quinone oxidoreductase subunit B
VGVADHDLAPQPSRYLFGSGPSLGLSVFDLGLACCAVEFESAATLQGSLVAAGADRSVAPADAHVMVVSGTVTDKLAPALLVAYRLLEPAYVVSFGSCANSGGPYWDSYSVTKGVDQLVPVDLYVPGCPPRPEALLDGLRRAQAAVSERLSRA